MAEPLERPVRGWRLFRYVGECLYSLNDYAEPIGRAVCLPDRCSGLGDGPPHEEFKGPGVVPACGYYAFTQRKDAEEAWLDFGLRAVLAEVEGWGLTRFHGREDAWLPTGWRSEYIRVLRVFPQENLDRQTKAALEARHGCYVEGDEAWTSVGKWEPESSERLGLSAYQQRILNQLQAQVGSSRYIPTLNASPYQQGVALDKAIWTAGFSDEPERRPFGLQILAGAILGATFSVTLYIILDGFGVL